MSIINLENAEKHLYLHLFGITIQMYLKNERLQTTKISQF